MGPISLGATMYTVQVVGPVEAEAPSRPSFDTLPNDAKWIQDTYEFLAGQVVVPECAVDWLAVLKTWVEFEHAMGFTWVVRPFLLSHISG